MKLFCTKESKFKDINKIDDYKKLVRDITTLGHYGNGDCEFDLNSNNDSDYLISLIKQSYNKNS